MKKLNDEQLSRVLSTHEAGALSPLPHNLRQICLLRAANCDDRWYYKYSADMVMRHPDASMDEALSAQWFDRNYFGRWSPDEFLSAMEKAGIA